MILRPTSASIALALAAALASGCFSYVPVEMAAVEPGEDVRVHLTREGSADLERFPLEGLEDEQAVRGSVLERDPTELLLRVRVSEVREGFLSVPIGQAVPIPMSAILQIERRKVNRAGTAMLVAGTAALAAVVIRMIIGGGEGRVDEEPPTPPEIRIPLFSVGIP